MAGDGLSRREIIEYAARYLDGDEPGDFPMNGDLFCIFSRDVRANQSGTMESQWCFEGYGICRRYLLDEDSKPRGKWLWFEYLSLATFPPHLSAVRLQPPHVVTGRFFTADRNREMRVMRLNVERETETAAANDHEHALPSNVLKFPGSAPRPKHSRGSVDR